MLVAYRVNPISAWVMKKISRTPYVNLINILLKSEVIPEFLQELCTPLILASAASQLLHDRAWQTRQKEGAAEALSQLVPPSHERPSDIAARTILELLSSPSPSGGGPG